MMRNVKNNGKLSLPYNSYNVFYILERERIINERNGKQPIRESSGDDFNYYGPLDLPPLPPRYHHLESTLVPNWYIPGARKLAKRKHVKSHGGQWQRGLCLLSLCDHFVHVIRCTSHSINSLSVASFKEISRIVADNWKAMDRTTQQYVQAVATILKKRHLEITQEVQLQQRQQGIGWCEDRTHNSWLQPPTVWHGMEQLVDQSSPSPVIVTQFQNMLGMLPESNFAPLPYCGSCDYSNLQAPIAFMPTTSSQHIPTEANHVSQDNFCDQDVLQMYLKIAANVSQHDAIPPSESNNNSEQSFFCGECTH